MLSADNQVQITATQGLKQAGVCVAGPLRGNRVVRHGSSSDAWFPAGQAKPSEMVNAMDFANMFKDIFGQ